MKEIRYNGVVYNFPDDATDDEIRQALEATDKGPSLMERVQQYLPSPRTAFQVGGATIGGALGTAGAPGLGTVAGGALGAGAGESLYQMVQRLRGASDVPQTSGEAASQIGSAMSGGALQEGMGVALFKVGNALATRIYRTALK